MEPTATKEQNYVVLARRWQNAKRSYLLVNPLQAKHLPVPPSAALGMMRALGRTVKESFPAVDLVIGFAETATAIGLAAAHELGAPYLQTTREPLPGEWVEFREEHSHAPEQLLYGDFLKEHLPKARTVLLVDDELSTGKTVRNMVGRLRHLYGGQAQYVTASILYRLGEADEAAMKSMAMRSVYLARPRERDYEREASKWKTAAPKKAEECPAFSEETFLTGIPSPDPRLGVHPLDYVERWNAYASRAADALAGNGASSRRFLLLGTEECMLPALLVGRELESRGHEVFCHATTRSPIGILSEEGYPITSGWQISSFYEEGRATYIYNLDRGHPGYDDVVVVSDAGPWRAKACRTLRSALGESGHAQCRITWIGGESDVRNLSR